MKYEYKKIGENTYEIRGPGLCYYGTYPSFLLHAEVEAEQIVRKLHAAFEAGREAKAAEVRITLGLGKPAFPG